MGNPMSSPSLARRSLPQFISSLAASVRVGLLAASLVAPTFVVAGLVGVAHAQSDAERARARAEFERGVAAFQANQYERALEAFQEAYRLAPHPTVRVNIANCYEQLDRPLEALFHFEHFLSEAERPNPAQRRDVEASIRRLAGRVGTIQLQVTPDGALVTIDDAEQRRAPVTEPVRVVAGQHTVEIRLAGYATERQTVVVEGGSSARVAIRLRRETAVAEAPHPTPRETPTHVAPRETTPPRETPRETPAQVEPRTTPPPRQQIAEAQRPRESEQADDADDEPGRGGRGVVVDAPTIIVGSVTVAAIVGSVITGVIALSNYNEYQRLATVYDASTSSEDDRIDAATRGPGFGSRASSFATVTDVLIATAAVGAVATTILFVVAQGGDDSSEHASLAPTFTPVLSPTLAGGVFTAPF